MMPLFSEIATDLLQRLLKRNPKQRLGSGPEGVDEIKNHPFFDGVDWAAMEEKDVPPLFVPTIESDFDLRNIDRMFTREKAAETPEDSSMLQKKKFDEFTYVGKSALN